MRVRAAGLHVGDVFAVKGSPFLVRLATGLRRPRYGVPGFDIAGEVTAVGDRVTRFKPGDQVFGAALGASAEYARAPEETMVAKPTNLTFEQAASIPTSGLAALHGLRDAAKLTSGQEILINGASGGVGTFAVADREVDRAPSSPASAARRTPASCARSAPTTSMDYTRRRLYPRRNALRRHLRQRREPFPLRRAACAHAPTVRSSSTAAPREPGSGCWSVS